MQHNFRSILTVFTCSLIFIRKSSFIVLNLCHICHENCKNSLIQMILFLFSHSLLMLSSILPFQKIEPLLLLTSISGLTSRRPFGGYRPILFQQRIRSAQETRSDRILLSVSVVSSSFQVLALLLDLS